MATSIEPLRIFGSWHPDGEDCDSLSTFLGTPAPPSPAPPDLTLGLSPIDGSDSPRGEANNLNAVEGNGTRRMRRGRDQSHGGALQPDSRVALAGAGGGDERCRRGGRRVRRNKDDQTRAQTRRASRLGPEGLGDQNDVDDPQEEGDDDREDLPGGDYPSQPNSLEPVPEEPVLSNHAGNVVSALAAVARDCICQSADSGIIASVHAVVEMLQGSPLARDPVACVQSPSLAILAKHCSKTEVLEACAHLSYWLSVLTFACQMNRWVNVDVATFWFLC